MDVSIAVGGERRRFEVFGADHGKKPRSALHRRPRAPAEEERGLLEDILPMSVSIGMVSGSGSGGCDGRFAATTAQSGLGPTYRADLKLLSRGSKGRFPESCEARFSDCSADEEASTNQLRVPSFQVIKSHELVCQEFAVAVTSAMLTDAAGRVHRLNSYS